MSTSSSSRGIAAAVAILVGVVAAVLVYKQTANKPPTPGTPKYAEMVSAFYRGVIGLDTGDGETGPNGVALVATELTKATQLVPQEPAAWADLGLYDLRNNLMPDAQQALLTASTLAPGNAAIEALMGTLANSQGDSAGAVAHFTKAVAANPADLKSRYALEQAIEQQAGPTADADEMTQLNAILQQAPSNVAIILDIARHAAKAGDKDTTAKMIGQLEPCSKLWPADSVQQFDAVKKTASTGDLRATGVQLQELANLLGPVPQYQSALADLQDATGSPGTPIDHFIVLRTPPATPAPPDTALTFAPQPIAGASGPIVRAVWLGRDGQPARVTVDGKQITVAPAGGTSSSVAFPSGPKAVTPGPDGVLPVDFNDDFYVDLVAAGAGGLKFYRQSTSPPVAFANVTANTKLPSAVLVEAYTGAWAADLFTGSVLDIVLGTASGAPIALRNNDDDTFTVVHPFPGAANGLTDFAWADLDGDGVNEAAFVDASGQLNVYHNLRSGSFEPWTVPSDLGKVAAVTAADVSHDDTYSLVVWGVDGKVRAPTRQPAANGGSGGTWTESDLATASAPPSDGTPRLIWADLDNNGALDLIATSSAGTQVFLAGSDYHLTPLAGTLDVKNAFIDDGPASGRVDLTGTSGAGAAVRLVNNSTKNYHWEQVRLYRKVNQGDSRNNTYAITAPIEIRAGLLYEDQIVDQPVMHFGLGTYASADACRVVWPNGVAQAELGLKPDQLVEAPEQLKGSCPWLFAWNGHSMNFLKDFLWRSAVGLRINAQNTVGSMMTGDWNKIDGEDLAPLNGSYDLRLTTQLWETYYFDMIKLKVVDHPANTQMWVDERFCVPPPKLAYHITTPAQPIVRAVDDLGNDVTSILSARDERYVDSFGLGRYQGITRDHYVQLDLGLAPRRGRLRFRGPARPDAIAAHQYLLANGWLHPTDSSINMMISFGSHPKPTGLSLQIPDGHGGWRTALPNLGFPEGKNKTIMIDVTSLFNPGEPQIVRLRTNLEIYWDWMATVTELPAGQTREVTLDPSAADLRYHGFDTIQQAAFSSPETPVYGKLAYAGQKWRDMTGYFTRFGDVRELLKTVDDRYVIQNAGDEIDLRFPAQPDPPAGWTRDYILIGDGWGKDCDIDGGFSKTVIPLPSHADTQYNRPPTTLADEPVYKAHKQDWTDYHTRYVTPDAFVHALVPR